MQGFEEKIAAGTTRLSVPVKAESLSTRENGYQIQSQSNPAVRRRGG
jgi:hypothetical protein